MNSVSVFIYTINFYFTHIKEWPDDPPWTLEFLDTNIQSIRPREISTQKVYAECLWAVNYFLQGRSTEENKDLILVLEELISLCVLHRRPEIKYSSGAWVYSPVTVAEILPPTCRWTLFNCVKPQLQVLFSWWDAYSHTQLLKHNISNIPESLLLGWWWYFFIFFGGGGGGGTGNWTQGHFIIEPHHLSFFFPFILR